ncbi:retrovirus-related pol polyprotein from transposon TNT 1-94 [Tanacetum coccineum]
MLGKTPNQVYDPFLKAGLGYKNLERLKKAIAAQQKKYYGEKLYSTKLKIDSPDSEETLKDSEESRLKMRNKMLRLSKLNDENVLLKTQVDYVVQEREKIKLEYQKLFNSIKATHAQHQQEVNELIENISQKTYAYSDVHSKNQDLFMVIFELKEKLKTFEKRNGVNTKFDKSVTSRKLLCVTPLSNDIAVQAKKVSNTKNNTERSKPVTSHSTPKNEQKQKKNANVIARGMYKIQKQESHTRDSKTNMNVSNSTGVGSSNSVRMPKSKDTKSKNRVMKNTNVKSSSAYVRKTVTAVNDGSNLVCVSCDKNVFLLSHEKYVARYGLSRDSRVKKALFTTPVAAKSKNLGATSVVAKSRFSVAKTPIATNKVSSASSLSPDSKQSRTLCNYMKNKITTSRKWQKWFEYQSCFNWTPKSKTAQSTPSVSKSSTSVRTKSKTPVITQKWVAKLSTPPSTFVSCEADDPAHPLDYLEVAFLSNTCYVRNLEGDDLLTGSHESNLYTISISKLVASSPVCLMSKATSTKSWLWHRRLSHLNFGTINQLTSKDLVHGLPKFKYDKDHLGLTCEQGNGKKASFPSKLVPSTESKLELIHMDLCGPMRVEKFLWAEAIATACFTQNRSLVHTWYNKNPYELIRGRNPNVQYFHVFGSLCYLTNDRDGLGKMKSKADLFEEAESSSNYQDPSNMHKFHQHRYTNKWTKNNPIEQVIGDPSKPVQTRNRLQTDAEVCMYALTVSLIKPKKSRKLCLIIAG